RARFACSPRLRYGEAGGRQGLNEMLKRVQHDTYDGYKSLTMCHSGHHTELSLFSENESVLYFPIP
ncbi:MAG: hypothetical protein QME16_07715, partial [Planctomycetota bacterium]|nr:hypothetical protein [Planctomycetota bacterium]